jgi:hypothetical protein
MANATIRVQFGTASGDNAPGHLSAEIDARANGSEWREDRPLRLGETVYHAGLCLG